MTDEPDSGESDSMLRRFYWILFGQFGSGNEDKLKFAIIAIGIGTGLLTLTAATTALLLSLQNWPFALILLVIGIGVLTFSWFVGLQRFDEWIVDDS